MALDWFDEPYKSEKFDSLFVEEKKKPSRTKLKKIKMTAKTKEDNKEKKEEKKEPVIKELKVNPENTLERIELVTDRYGYQDDPVVFASDKKEILFFNSNQDNGKKQLFKKYSLILNLPSLKKFLIKPLIISAKSIRTFSPS
jgi:hypothetical protein